MESNSYIRSQTVDICLYRNSTIISRSQRLGYKRAGPSGLAELEQLHVESNSECNRHVYLSSTLANSHFLSYRYHTRKHVARLRMRPRRACEALCGYVFLVILHLTYCNCSSLVPRLYEKLGGAWERGYNCSM